jgi:hypothetical protein
MSEFIDHAFTVVLLHVPVFEYASVLQHLHSHSSHRTAALLLCDACPTLLHLPPPALVVERCSLRKSSSESTCACAPSLVRCCWLASLARSAPHPCCSVRRAR